ncbi:hypothetical protein BKA70DRAFT_1438389 [Coprinopsis sp. MPI-PUGE-AT-0042]|nr:hypothetical protein BKA70DRAFT_1438389 [Coprinopsis sp. MPI-PUGE-AT-0042]
MCTTDPNTPMTTPRCLVDRPIVSRRFLKGLGSQGGGRQVTPTRAGTASPSMTRTHSSQGSVSLPVTNLLVTAGPLIFGPPFPPLHQNETGEAGAASHLEPSLLPPAPIVDAGLNFSYPQAVPQSLYGYTVTAPRSSLDPANVSLFPAGESSSSNIQPYLGPIRTLGSAFSPKTRERIITGKRRMTRAASATLQGLLTLPQPPAFQAAAPQNVASAPISSDAGHSPESERIHFPQVIEIKEYIIPDSDEESAVALSSSSTEDDDEVSASDASSDSIIVTDPVSVMLERLRSIEDAPQVTSDSITESSDNESASSHRVSLGATPSFMTASTNHGMNGSPITVRGSSTDPEVPAPRSARLRQESAPFFEKSLDETSFVKGIEDFNPIEPMFMLLLNLTHPGPGITTKELQCILRRCVHCSKFAYVLSQGRHICDCYAEASVDEPWFQLQHYLSTYDQPFGLSLRQLGRVFVRCGDCDRIMWRNKKENHICSRDARLAAERNGTNRPRAGGSGRAAQANGSGRAAHASGSGRAAHASGSGTNRRAAQASGPGPIRRKANGGSGSCCAQGRG